MRLFFAALNRVKELRELLEFAALNEGVFEDEQQENDSFLNMLDILSSQLTFRFIFYFIKKSFWHH